MGREHVHVALMLAAALALAGCGFADSHSPLPSFMRAKEAEPPPLEAPPDVKRLVGTRPGVHRRFAPDPCAGLPAAA
jgi:hypothetical protein